MSSKKDIIGLKLLIHKQIKIKIYKKVLGDAGDLFNELYYIYNNKYNEEEYGLNSRDRKIFNYQKLRLAEYYQYESEEEREQQTSKKPDKKELPKKPTKDDSRKFNEWVNKKETGIGLELFKKQFNFQRPSHLLKTVYNTNGKKKSNDLVIMIKSELSDLKRKLKT